MLCQMWADVAAVREANPKVAVPHITDERVERMARWASEMLFDLTGRRWPGECVRTVRPRHDPGCLCAGAWQWPLGPYPVVRVEEVLLDGAVLAAAEYRLDEQRLLVRLDGRWPCRQDVRKPTTEEGTWQVRYAHGALPPQGGREAAALLAGQLALAGTSECRLPARTQSVARQGVTVTVYPQGLIASGQTGIAEIDMWVASVNPQRARARSTVMSPDFRSTVRRAL